MKKIKKSVFVLFFSLFAAAVLSVCAFGAWDYETEHSYFFKHNNTESYFYFLIDDSNKRAMITSFNTFDDTAYIPQVLKAFPTDDSVDDCDYTATSVKIPIVDIYDSSKICRTVIVPETVTEIENLGYCRNWENFWEDDESESDEPKTEKIPSFTIGCIKGSYAETYAKQNGFKIKYYSPIRNENIKLSADSFMFKFDDIEPDVTVTVDGEKLIRDVDYTVSYKDNYEVGTGTVTVLGLGEYVGIAEKTFSITKIPANLVSASFDNSVLEYDERALTPYVSVTYGDFNAYEGYDYKVTYSNNVYPGTATAKITFIGDYFTGTKTLTFKIVVPSVSYPEIEAKPDTSVFIGWEWNFFRNPKQFNIYRYDEKVNKYVKVGKTTGERRYFKDKTTTQLTKYVYKIVPVISAGGQYYAGTAVKLSVTTPLTQPTVKGALYKNSIKLKWTKNQIADGYIVYRRTIKATSLSGAKKLRTFTKNTANTFTDTTISPKLDYYYTIRAFKKVGNKTYYSLEGSYCASDTPSTILAGAQLKRRDSIKVYNTQGKKTTYYTYTISARDKQVLKKFADKHFTKNMSREEKLFYTLNWINKKVRYAEGSDWEKIAGKGYADAIFTYRLGQCVQYNGAMAEMMAYLGYDAYLIQGYRGSKTTGRIWQHFWCEVNINGRVYLMETGNYECDGNWSYFLVPYKQTSGYIKNGKFLGY
ncbi:MAG: transglutaminase-like domain-containing protein [Clostridia bacterium]|nr:transglutaminase-like domain-containing protein [Clostridia bacterium]